MDTQGVDALPLFELQRVKKQMGLEKIKANNASTLEQDD
jgi:hypothetical protein